MKRWQWGVVAILGALVALEALVYAQPAPNNCGLNMLCRVRDLIVTGTATFIGNVTLDGGSTVNGDFYVNGDAGISTNLSIVGFTQGQDAGFNRVGVTAGLHTLNTAGTMCFNGTTGPCIGYQGATDVGPTGTNGWVVPGRSQAQGVLDVLGYASNSGLSSNCLPDHGNAFCINDTGGLSGSNGASLAMWDFTTAGTLSLDGGINVGDSTGTPLGAITSAGLHQSAATSGNQFACTGAATCNVQSASGQTAALDCGGGTCTASLGATNATTSVVGRSGQTTTINGSATFGTAGPSLGGAVTGTVGVYAAGLLTATTNYGAFSFANSVTNVSLGNVTCTHAVAGTSTAATLAVRNVTDSSTLCSGSYSCTTSANTPTLIFACNQAPLANKAYALQFTTGCGGTQVTGLNCSIEVAH